MERRNFLGSVIAAVTGYLFGSEKVVAQRIGTDQAEGGDKTVTALAYPRDITFKLIECETLKIDHRGDGSDGFQTFAVIDGKMLPAIGLYGRTIEVFVNAGELPYAVVECLRNPHSAEPEEVVVRIHCKQLKMNCGTLSVETQPERYPCKVTIEGFELRVKSLRIRFAEGEECCVDMAIITRPK